MCMHMLFDLFLKGSWSVLVSQKIYSIYQRIHSIRENTENIERYRGLFDLLFVCLGLEFGVRETRTIILLIHTRIHARMNTHTHTHTHTHTCTRTHICIHTHANKYMHARTRTCTRAHAHMTQTRTYDTHTQLTRGN